MTKYFLLILTVPIFFIFWWLIGKSYAFFSRIAQRLNENNENKINLVDNLLHVFSVETVIGTEAEFINEYLPEKKRVVIGFRLILLVLYVTFMIYFFNKF